MFEPDTHSLRHQDFHDYKASGSVHDLRFENFKIAKHGDLLMSSSDTSFSKFPEPNKSPAPTKKFGEESAPSKFTDGLPVSQDEIRLILSDLKTLNDEIKLLPGGRMTTKDAPNKKDVKKVQVGEIRLRPSELRSLMSSDVDFDKRFDRI